MLTQIKAALRHGTARHLGLRVSRILPLGEALKRDYPDVEPWILAIVERIHGLHMTSPERVHAACKAVEYVVSSGIEGEIVKCGVWRGGSSMAMALSLLHLRNTERHLYLFDTFEGMPPPGDIDRDASGATAASLLTDADAEKRELIQARAGLDEVVANMRSTQYPEARVHFVKGRVENTLPAQAPEQIALLRLDTDWYESTIHELRSLWSRLAIGGILIIDDYGQWTGARHAADEFFAGLPGAPLLARIDYSGRLAVKTR